MFKWLAEKIRDCIEWLVEAMWIALVWIWEAFVHPFAEWLSDLWEHVVDWFLNTVCPALLEGLCSLLQTFGLEVEFGDIDTVVGQVQVYADKVDWVVPVYGMLSILFAAFVVRMSVRLVRLIIWVCPFIG